MGTSFLRPWLALLLLVLHVPQAGASLGGVLVAEPVADPQVEDVARGAGQWLVRQIRAAGLAAERAPVGSTPDIESALALAASQGAAYVVVPRLRVSDGEAEARWLLFPAIKAELVTAPSARAPLAKVGDACRPALLELLAAIGADAGRVSGVPPTLDELASTGRALAELDRGHLLRAWREVQGKLSPTAMALRESLIESARHSGPNVAERARVLAAAGSETRAWKLIAPLLEDPSPERSLLLAATEVQLARGHYRAAFDSIDRLLDAIPSDPDATFDLGVLEAAAGREERARETLGRAAELDPDNPRPLLELAPLVQTPEARARVLHEAGTRSAAQWNLHRANRLLGKASSLEPELAQLTLHDRGRLAQDVGQSAEALEAWREAAASDGQNAEVWAGIGRAQHALGDPEARASFERALELAPEHAGALTELGQLHLEFGRAELAVPLLERAVHSAPEQVAARVALARALRASARPDEALAVLRDPGAPTALSAAALCERAALERETGDLAAARASLKQATVLEPWSAELEEERARLAEAAGDAGAAERARSVAALLGDGAEGAELAATNALDLDKLALAFAAQTPHAGDRVVAQIGLREARGDWRTLAERWLLPRTPAVAHLSAGLDHALALRFARADIAVPDTVAFQRAVDGLYEFSAQRSLDAQTIADVNNALGADALVVTRIVRHSGGASQADACFAKPGTFALESRMLRGTHPDVVTVLAAVQCLPEALSAHGQWNARALPFYGLACLLLAFPVLRGWGGVLVEIKLPPRTRGFLAIRVGRKPLGTSEAKKERERRESAWRRLRRAVSRYEKNMAGRETLFRWIPARSYYVTVRGPLFDAMGDEEIGFFLEEQRVKVERGRATRLRYDFNPSEVVVLVSVQNDGEPLRGARVALREDPNSLRYARDGTAHFYLGEGTHTICAGFGDRAGEASLTIDSLENAVQLAIDLGNERNLLVRGAEDAVEPYLLGDFAMAARAMLAAGEEQLGHLMQGAHHQQRGEIEEAAREFEAAGCIEEAAELRASGSDHGGSAKLFERAGEFSRAADAHRIAGEFAEAARCYESAYDWDSAIECWEAVGDFERVIDLHEKQGHYLEAAGLSVRHGNLDRALYNLQQVERRDANYSEACAMTAEVLAERGDFDAAAQRQAEAIEIAGGQSAPAALHAKHAEYLSQTTDKQAALAAYETVRRLDPRREDVTQHIEELRTEISTGPASAGSRHIAAPAGTPSRYEILEEIGRGGMGVVYKARDTRLGRIVALKRLPDNLRDNEAAGQLFLREARAAAALNHMNIVTVYDADEENGVYHITMELLEGLPINAIQERRGPLSVPDTARIGIQVCAGLHYAHEQRIVHRDIKTANLFFTREKVVKIMDFGLAKTIEEVRKNSTVIGGTPYYMAPEQASGGAVGPATDLYALGVTFFRLLTGTFPFSEGDLAYHHRHTPAPDVRECREDLSEEVARLLADLLAKEPEQRPASAVEVARRLASLA